VIYRLACESGLRANELRSLKVSSFDFAKCTVTISDGSAKNRKEKTLPLRHTTASLLAASGVHPKTAQEIMRHSDINLTLSHYTHVLRGQEAEAVSNLPDLGAPSAESQRAVRTGTDNQNISDPVLASCLALLCAGQRPTMPLGDKLNLPDAIKNRISEYPRKDSNLQPLAPEANALSN